MGKAKEPEKWRTVKYSPNNPPTGPDNTIITSRFTLLTFLYKSIIEQFRRKSNVFFLITSITMLVAPIPGRPIGFVFTFICILSISIIKSVYEDWLKHKTDDQVNSRRIQILDSRLHIVETTAKSLRVGQVVRLDENEDVPCDLLLLASVSQEGKSVTTCGVNTVNLDGEPNMKVRQCPVRLHVEDPLRDEDFGTSLAKSELVVEFENPTADLYKFSGLLRTAQTREKPVGLSMENLLLRGTTVKNSQFIYGLVIYAGKDTRLSYNLAQRKRSKFSVIDVATNRLIVIMAAILMVFCGMALGGFFWFKDSIRFREAWYLMEYDGNQTILVVETFMLFLVFLSGMVPIGLSASVELQKLWARLLFRWDDDMKCEETGNEAICNNSDVVDELGQIEYLLTDKTGTLTENNLKFRCCSFGGSTYEYSTDENWNQFYLKSSSPQFKTDSGSGGADGLEFWESIALCHTLHAVRKDHGWEYQGTSSDEEVLLTAASTLGVIYTGEDNNGRMSIVKDGQQCTFRRHLILEFDSDRKCMSVVVEDAENRFFLITKGAETSLLPKCQQSSAPESFRESTNNVSQFAKRGLRTLVVGKREMSSQEFAMMESKMEGLRRDPSALVEFYGQIESNLVLLGVTGVEDKLQSNVPETLKALKEAGIRIWILTGDKLETALNIAMTCGLIHGSCSSTCQDENEFPECTFSLINISHQIQLTQILQDLRNKMKIGEEMKTLVIDSTTFAIGYEHCRQLLGTVALAAPQIIFCRLTPLQKALVAKLIKSTGTSAHICAVGDGGNDVAMIQEAHVGIGIMGREGRQAARAADFAIHKFEHLRKAILVHGNWNYGRIATLVMYFLYQSIPLCLLQFLYGIDSGFSGYPLYDAEFPMFYSVLFSNWHINAYAMTERSNSVKELLSNPWMYKKNRRNRIITGVKPALYWMGIGVWHTILIRELPMLIWRDIDSMSWATYSLYTSSALVALTNLKLLRHTRTFNWLTLSAYDFSFVIMVVIYSLTAEVAGIGMVQYAYYSLLIRPDFWCVILLVVLLSLLPDYIFIAFRIVYLKRFTHFYKA